MKYFVSLLGCLSLFGASSIALTNQAATEKHTKKPSPTALNRVNTIHITKHGAAKQVKQRFPGKVLNVKDKKNFYRVRMLQAQGKVVDYRVNKSNGTINKDTKKNAHSNNRR